MLSSVSNANHCVNVNTSNQSSSKTIEEKVPASPAEVVACQGAVAEGRIETASYTYNQYCRRWAPTDHDYFHTLRALAENGNTEAQFQLGLRFENRLDVFDRQPESYLKIAADQDHVEAAYRYGQRVRNVYYGLEDRNDYFYAAPAFTDAEIYLRKAAAQGHTDASCQYARLFINPPSQIYPGSGYLRNPLLERSVEQRLDDLQNAANLLRIHAVRGNEEAQLTYAQLVFEILHQATNGPAQDTRRELPDAAEALNFLEQGAEGGSALAQYEYAMRVVHAARNGEPWLENIPLALAFERAEGYLEGLAQNSFSFDAQQAYAEMWLQPAPLFDHNGKQINNPLLQRSPQEQLSKRQQAMGFLYEQAVTYRCPEAQRFYARIVLGENYEPASNPREAVVGNRARVQEEAAELMKAANYTDELERLWR